MKILQISSLLTPDGAYGGPTRVATNQCEALIAAGHSVLMCAVTTGFDVQPDMLGKIPLRTFVGRKTFAPWGFSGLTSPSFLFWVLSHARSFDAIHIHMSRDLTTLPAALVARALNKNVFVQTHGMIMPSTRRSSRILDVLLTRHVLKFARRCFYLTEAERAGLTAVQRGKTIELMMLRNGVPRAGLIEHSPQDNREVLFLARLHERKNPAIFVRAAALVLQSRTDVKFGIVGPDDGEGTSVLSTIRDEGVEQSVMWSGAIAPATSILRMQQAHIYVLPSIDEPYPMSVLEAMSVGLPVIVTPSCGLAHVVQSSNAGLVVPADASAIAEAIEAILADDHLHRLMSANGYELSQKSHSMEEVASILESVYADPRERDRQLCREDAPHDHDADDDPRSASGPDFE